MTIVISLKKKPSDLAWQQTIKLYANQPFKSKGKIYLKK